MGIIWVQLTIKGVPCPWGSLKIPLIIGRNGDPVTKGRKEVKERLPSKHFFSRCVLGTVNLGIFCEDPGIHVKNLYGIHWGFPMFIVEEGGWKVEWEAGAGEKYP